MAPTSFGPARVDSTLRGRQRTTLNLDYSIIKWEVGLSINLTLARLVPFHHALCLPLRRLRLSILLDQYSSSNLISALVTLPSIFAHQLPLAIQFVFLQLQSPPPSKDYK